MNFLKGIEVIDTKNKKWGIGKLDIINNKLVANFRGKPGFKYESYSYPLDFMKRLTVKTEDETILQRIQDDIWFEKAEKESLAFKYNLCDGGCSETNIGFNGVCSDECLRSNIENANRAWCSISPCSKYLNGLMTRDEIEKEYQRGEFFCYESSLLKTWKAGIGTDYDGRPRRIGSDVRDGLAIMTSVFNKGEERNRFIFAVFFIRSQEFGDDMNEGSVSAVDGDKPQYVILLSRNEASKMKFWNYYSNPNEPNKIMWGTGLYRFVSHAISARILKDIVEIKEDAEEKRKAQEFLDMFCKTHDITTIPEKSGALCSEN